MRQLLLVGEPARSEIAASVSSLGTVHAHVGRRVVGVDPAPFRRALALRFGADTAVTPQEAQAALA